MPKTYSTHARCVWGQTRRELFCPAQAQELCQSLRHNCEQQLCCARMASSELRARTCVASRSRSQGCACGPHRVGSSLCSSICVEVFESFDPLWRPLGRANSFAPRDAATGRPLNRRQFKARTLNINNPERQRRECARRMATTTTTTKSRPNWRASRMATFSERVLRLRGGRLAAAVLARGCRRQRGSPASLSE